jgi:hypothetical protein
MTIIIREVINRHFGNKERRQVRFAPAAVMEKRAETFAVQLFYSDHLGLRPLVAEAQTFIVGQ